MSTPATGAKYVAALVVGVVGAGTFAGVSHDGRGGASAPEPGVEAPTTTAAAPPSTTLEVTTTRSSTPSAEVESTAPALPAPPDTVPERARVRSRGS